MKEYRGRVTLVLTPELRRLALTQVTETFPEHKWDEVRDLLTDEFYPDGAVIDATMSASDALIIQSVAAGILSLYTYPGTPQEAE